MVIVSSTEKSCPLYEPPKNGALVCIPTGIDGIDNACSVMCQTGNDFVSSVPLLYYCSSGKWQFFSVLPFHRTLPWPDCAGKFS